MSSPPPIIFRLSELEPWVSERRFRSALVISDPSTGLVDRLRPVLGGIELEVFDGPDVEEAAAILERLEPQLLIGLGGGGAIALAGRVRLARDLPLVAVPTTHAGSELVAGPELIVHDAELARDTPLAPSVASLIHALSCPVAALVAGSGGDRANAAIASVTGALSWVLQAPRSPRARRAAFDAAVAARALGEIAGPIDRFAGSRDELHGVLLPHFIASLDPAIDDAAGVVDLPAMLYDALVRTGAAVSLRALGVEVDEPPAWVRDAYLGLRPSRRIRKLAEGLWAGGVSLEDAGRVVVALHDRGGLATDAIAAVRAIVSDHPEVAILAPQSPAIAEASEVVERAVAAVGRDRVFVCGLGSGASLARDLIAAQPDLAEMITVDGARDRLAARSMILGWSLAGGPSGFGNSHEVELLPGALPRDQNSPRQVAYGLWAEQINGTGFVAPRERNRRSWLYRIRPATQHRELVAIEQPRLCGRFDDLPIEPDLIGFAPPPIPDAPVDFVDGLTTLGGAGRAGERRGYAVHVYAINRSMERRAFANADGDLLLIPQLGAVTLLTELGALEVAPGAIAVIPRGLKISVLVDGQARGWVAEVFGRSFELPDRGPVGANGLADPRHFSAPSPLFEDRLDPGYRFTTKIAGALWEATQDWSPYDVVAWHGNHCPYRYELSSFSPVGNTRVDHGDPSIFTVLTAPLDERGASSLDFLFFPPRWDPTEHTFRPPFFHRNPTAEINGVIADPGLGPNSPFQPGCTFITPPMTAHGVLARSAEAALHAGDRPTRSSDRSMWFQLESALPMALTPHAAAARIDQWRGEWGAYRPRYSPRS